MNDCRNKTKLLGEKFVMRGWEKLVTIFDKRSRHRDVAKTIGLFVFLSKKKEEEKKR